MIPETNVAKALWLKQNHPDLWKQCHCIIDLGDYLVWKMTDEITHTNCSLSRRFDDRLIRALDFDDIRDRFHGEHHPIGAPVGSGLSASAAKALKLPSGIPVSSAIIDGYGGTLATVLARKEGDDTQFARNCAQQIKHDRRHVDHLHFNQYKIAKNIDGAWGPIPSVLPGLHHNIVGQTAAGVLLDYILTRHPAREQTNSRARQKGKSITDYLNDLLVKMAGHGPVAYLTQNHHMLPYFAGNRTPRMDMTLTGMISGLKLDDSEQNLALSYLCTIQALALGARHNIETLISAGYDFSLLTPAGGLAKNTLFLSEHCNATGLPAAVPEQADAMLLSGVMTAGLAANTFPDWITAIQTVSRYESIINPDPELAGFYDKKYCVFLEMFEDQLKYKKIMGDEF